MRVGCERLQGGAWWLQAAAGNLQRVAGRRWLLRVGKGCENAQAAAGRCMVAAGSCGARLLVVIVRL